uniref:(northern house mosquito) hypothetical protein n=1 Tax=Culex pipiens TaxID=7175 RepID=A0A8D8PFD9_CULPI
MRLRSPELSRLLAAGLLHQEFAPHAGGMAGTIRNQPNRSGNRPLPVRQQHQHAAATSADGGRPGVQLSALQPDGAGQRGVSGHSERDSAGFELEPADGGRAAAGCVPGEVRRTGVRVVDAG